MIFVHHFLTIFETTPSLILIYVFILFFSLSIVFVQSQEEKSDCHQSCLILVVQITSQTLIKVQYHSLHLAKRHQRATIKIITLKSTYKEEGDNTNHDNKKQNMVGLFSTIRKNSPSLYQ